MSRKNLLANVTIKKSRTSGPRRGRKQKNQGAGMRSSIFKLRTKLFKPSYLRKGFEIGSRAANSALVKRIIEKGIKQTPAIYNAGVKRIKNNKKKSVLESDLANYTVKKTQGQLYNWQNA